MNVFSQKHTGIAWLRWVRDWSIFPIGLIATAYAVQGRSVAEKTATELITPVALVWWVCIVLALKLWHTNDRRTASIFFGISLLIYLASAPVIAKLPIRFLETRIQPTQLSLENPLETLIVLGGGTSETPDGRAQFSTSGDRIGLALQLYHQGLVKHLVVTGDSLKGLDQATRNDPSSQAKRIFVGFGISESSIEELDGSNTSEELRSIKERPDLWKGKRCGLVTSAFHMPRALSLAKKNGVEILPIMADYRTSTGRFAFRDLIPGAHGASQFDIALREFLGMLIGR